MNGIARLIFLIKVIIDLLVQLSTGESIIIEMQTLTQTNLKLRTLYYASKVLRNKIEKLK
ncbi:PD-(D/E)XK nuclease family transposase [Sphingobacterium faecium]|uniref:PD-(D/E)XK nuclease family transposase n=1 Tax=Sphingobacterium faecium TaxID=34087 RepID=UPI003D7F86D5